MCMAGSILTGTSDTLDELLQFYECHPLSPEIRNIGSPCVPPHMQRKKTSLSSSQEESLPPSSSYAMKDMNEITREMLQAITKQSEAHMQQMNEQRKYFDEKLEKEQDLLLSSKTANQELLPLQKSAQKD